MKPAATFVPWVYSGLRVFNADAVINRVYQFYPFALGGTALLLLLACANTANLLLTRLAGRQRDLALRGALGAGRARLLRGLLTEAILLSSLAGAAGVMLALTLTNALASARLFRVDASLTDLSLDWRVVAFALGTTAATVVVFALLPVIGATRVDLRRLFHQNHRGAPGARRLRGALVTVQFAVAVALIATAAMLTRSVLYRTGLALGLSPDGVVEFTINTKHLGLKDAAHDALVKTALTRLAGVPGVAAVGVSSPPAFSASTFTQTVRLDDDVDGRTVKPRHNVVSAGYFRALDIPLRAGQLYGEGDYSRDAGSGDGAVVISESLARELFGDALAVSRTLRVSSIRGGTRASLRRVQVVGVVGDVRSGASFLDDHVPAIYEPRDAAFVSDTFYLRTGRGAREVLDSVRTMMREIAPGLPLTDVRTLRDEVAELFPEDLALARLMRLVAALAGLLGAAGVYAVMTFAVSDRTREFGIRIALGATSADVTRLVLKGAGATVAAGLAVGLVLFMSTSHLLAARLTGVRERDPLTLAAASALLCLAALVAAWVPTRRATRISPTVALRSE